MSACFQWRGCNARAGNAELKSCQAWGRQCGAQIKSSLGRQCGVVEWKMHTLQAASRYSDRRGKPRLRIASSQYGRRNRRGPCAAGAARVGSQVKSDQLRSGQVRSGQVKSSQVRSSQVRSGQVRSGQVKSSPVQSGQVRSAGFPSWSKDPSAWSGLCAWCAVHGCAVHGCAAVHGCMGAWVRGGMDAWPANTHQLGDCAKPRLSPGKPQ